MRLAYLQLPTLETRRVDGADDLEAGAQCAPVLEVADGQSRLPVALLRRCNGNAPGLGELHCEVGLKPRQLHELLGLAELRRSLVGGEKAVAGVQLSLFALGIV